MVVICDNCAAPLTEKPLGQRASHCAECRWKSDDHKLKRAERQFRWLWNLGIKAVDDD
jgi:hypothetical protein